jgi:uncharacterized membrane protein YhfC
MDNVTISIVPAVGMMAVAGGAVAWWQRKTGLPLAWFWRGAGLWTVAVILKMVCAVLTNQAVLLFMKERLPQAWFVVCGGAYVGIQSSLFEIGLTILAGCIWRQMGQDAKRAIGIGIGAGAFEAGLLGAGSLVAMFVTIAGVPGTEAVRDQVDKLAATTTLFWLVGPVERSLAIACHASTRALVLLGTTHRKPAMVAWGFLLFAVLDGIAGAAIVSGKIGKVSMWWIELAVAPCAIISIPILRWCYRRWGAPRDREQSAAAGL